MSIFEKIEISWKGEDYVVQPDKVMGLIEVIEDTITLEELANGKGIKRSKISRAFYDVLRYAGAKGISREEIYSGLFDPSKSVEMQEIINTLLTMMIPPEHLRSGEESPKAQAADES